jgi:hypothetical protein
MFDSIMLPCSSRVWYIVGFIPDLVEPKTMQLVEWLLLNVNSASFQLYHGDNKLIFNEMMMRFTLYWTNTLSWIFIVVAHLHNIPRVDMSFHSDTLFWFRANQSLRLKQETLRCQKGLHFCICSVYFSTNCDECFSLYFF